jgi:hypothetical protein
MYSPCLVAALVVLPRLLSPQFGLLDDGGMLTIAQEIRSGELPFRDLGDGRFRPAYWLWWGMLYAVAGPHPLWFFLAVAAVFCASVAAIILLVRRVGGTQRQAWLTGMLLAVSGPAIESHYTLSKAEPLQLLLLLSILLVASKVTAGPRSEAVRTAGIGFLTLLSAACKETTLLLAPITLVWWGLAWWRGRHDAPRSSLSGWRALAGGSVLGSGLFVALRQILIGQALVGFGYTERYEVYVSRILSSAARWGAWLVHDFAYVVPLLAGLVLLGRFAWRGMRPGLLPILVWLFAWMGFYLPWLYVADYYLLPFAAGTVVLAAGCVECLLEVGQAGHMRKVVAGIALGLSACLLPAALANSLTMARLQLLTDAANSEALAYLAASAPEGADVQVNIQQESEYLDEIADHLHLVYERPDLSVTRLNLEAIGESGMGPALIAAPFIRHQVLLSPRIGVYERYQVTDNSKLEAALAGSAPVGSIEKQVHAASVDPARLACPLLLMRASPADAQEVGVMGSIRRYCENAPAIDTRMVEYGWRFYAVPQRDR